MPIITGRVVDALTGRGIAGISLESSWREVGRNLIVGEATTDAEGWHKIEARPGTTVIESTRVPKTHLAPNHGDLRTQEVKADQMWPDTKLSPAAALDGMVVDSAGHPAAAAQVYLLGDVRAGASWNKPILTGSTRTATSPVALSARTASPSPALLSLTMATPPNPWRLRPIPRGDSGSKRFSREPNMHSSGKMDIARRRDGRGRPGRRLCPANRLPRHGKRDHVSDGGAAQRNAKRIQ